MCSGSLQLRYAADDGFEALMTVDTDAAAMASRVRSMLQNGDLDRYDSDTWMASFGGRPLVPPVPGEQIHNAEYILHASDPRRDTWDGGAKDQARTAYSNMVRSAWTGGGTEVVKALAAIGQLLLTEAPFCYAKAADTPRLLNAVFDLLGIEVPRPAISNAPAAPAGRASDPFDVVGKAGANMVSLAKSMNAGRYIPPGY
jgi:hypothetical protein